MKNKNKWELENKMQFKNGNGTQECITYLTTQIEIGFSANQCTIEIVLDLKSANDRVNLDLLFKKIRELDIPNNITISIYEIISNRYIH